MKKGIIVLLIAVLVAGFAFADGKAGDATFKGSATISYDYDLDLKDTGIVNAKAMKYNFKFEFNSTKPESKGEGKLYAEIAASAVLELEAKNVTATGNLNPKATLKITKANIVAGDLTIDILGPKGFYSFAEFYADDEFDETQIPEDDTLADLGLGNHGFVATYKDFSASIAFWRYGDNGLVGAPAPQTSAYVGLKTPAFKLADGMTLTAGANFYFNKLDADDNALIFAGGGFDFQYAPEESKLSASLAADVLAIMYGADNSILPIDIAAQVKYDFITADVYFLTIDKFDSTLDFLAAKLSADYAVNDALSVGGYAEVLWVELIGEGDPEFRFGANVAYTAEKFAVEAGADAWLKKAGDEYKFAPGLYYDGDEYPGLGVWVDVYSKALIDNATVGIKWTGSDFSQIADEVVALGRISAYATIAF